jgi:DNA-binding LytR/AlgR family response regulator
LKIQINEDSNLHDTEIIINCKKTDEKILKIVTMLSVFDKKVTGVKNNQTYILDVSKILYIDTVDKKTFFYTKDNVYETPLKLYELEEQLEFSDFFRAGKSIIINFKQIKALKPDIDGRILVTMSNDEKLFVSRQYASIIKNKLEVM